MNSWNPTRNVGSVINRLELANESTWSRRSTALNPVDQLIIYKSVPRLIAAMCCCICSTIDEARIVSFECFGKLRDCVGP
jgi:hypothetical protein